MSQGQGRAYRENWGRNVTRNVIDEKRIFLLVSNVFQKIRCVSIAYYLLIATYTFEQNHEGRSGWGRHPYTQLMYNFPFAVWVCSSFWQIRQFDINVVVHVSRTHVSWYSMSLYRMSLWYEWMRLEEVLGLHEGVKPYFPNKTRDF